MEINQQTQKKLASEWFEFLQKKICEEFENIEKEYSRRRKLKPKYFKKNEWNKKNINDGGGKYYLLQNGQIFDKVGVNHSTVQGLFPKKFKSNIPGTNKNNSYWASGISVVAHMKNPKMPAIHFNTRFVITSKSWWRMLKYSSIHWVSSVIIGFRSLLTAAQFFFNFKLTISISIVAR